MKNAFNRILPFFFITGFILYWISIFILAMPSNVVKGFITDRTPRYNSLFGNSWNFFAPPYTYYNRLYYIIREKAHPNKVDTIEVIENISKQKQHNAPFNQKENIIDHLINHDVGMIIYIVWKDKRKPSDSEPGTTDSIYIASAIASVAENSNYLNRRQLFLRCRCRWWLWLSGAWGGRRPWVRRWRRIRLWFCIPRVVRRCRRSG